MSPTLVTRPLHFERGVDALENNLNQGITSFPGEEITTRVSFCTPRKCAIEHYGMFLVANAVTGC